MQQKKNPLYFCTFVVYSDLSWGSLPRAKKKLSHQLLKPGTFIMHIVVPDAVKRLTLNGRPSRNEKNQSIQKCVASAFLSKCQWFLICLRNYRNRWFLVSSPIHTSRLVVFHTSLNENLMLLNLTWQDQFPLKLVHTCGRNSPKLRVTRKFSTFVFVNWNWEPRWGLLFENHLHMSFSKQN